MFPLEKRKIGGYRFMEKTFYSAHHLGVDYSAHYNKLYTPFDGKIVRTLNGKQGGLTIWLEYKNYIIRFLHLSEIRCKTGEKVKKGQTIGITGNTGKLTTAPHLHLDISKNSVQLKNINNFIDPEKFNWDNNMKYEENFRKIFKYVKSLIEKDFGKNPNDKETKEIKKDLKDIKQTFKLMLAQNIQLRDVATTFDVKINELETARDIQAATIDELEDTIGRQTTNINMVEGINRDLKKELKSKEALIDKDAEGTKVYDAILFVIQTIKNRIK